MSKNKLVWIGVAMILVPYLAVKLGIMFIDAPIMTIAIVSWVALSLFLIWKGVK